MIKIEILPFLELPVEGLSSDILYTDCNWVVLVVGWSTHNDDGPIKETFDEDFVPVECVELHCGHIAKLNNSVSVDWWWLQLQIQVRRGKVFPFTIIHLELPPRLTITALGCAPYFEGMITSRNSSTEI